MLANGTSPGGFPTPSPALGALGLKFSAGGAHISRTMMLTELAAVLASVSIGASPDDYREAVIKRNVLGKTTDSTRQKSFRHLRELYALDEAIPLFGLLRKLHAMDPDSLPLLAAQVAWSRDTLFRATTAAVLGRLEGEQVDTGSLANAVETAFPRQYSELNRNKIARNAASSWTQAGHLSGHLKKVRRMVAARPVAVTLALFLGNAAGYHGTNAFTNPWCRLLDLRADRARSMAMEARRQGLLDLRAAGEVVELSFPRFAGIEAQPA